MFLGRKQIVGITGVAFLLAGAHKSLASITVHDLSENLSTGVFTYTIQCDDAADVQTNDGFVIFDFPNLTSFSISGSLSSSQFTLTQTLTSNTLNQADGVDTVSDAAAIVNGVSFDSPSVENLSFAYVGPPIPFLGAATAVLTLTSTDLGADATSVYGSVDHSGPTQSVPYSLSSNPVLVPTVVPEPASIALLSLAGLPLLLRRRKRLA